MLSTHNVVEWIKYINLLFLDLQLVGQKSKVFPEGGIMLSHERVYPLYSSCLSTDLSVSALHKGEFGLNIKGILDVVWMHVKLIERHDCSCLCARV